MFLRFDSSPTRREIAARHVLIAALMVAAQMVLAFHGAEHGHDIHFHDGLLCVASVASGDGGLPLEIVRESGLETRSDTWLDAFAQGPCFLRNVVHPPPGQAPPV